jgi:LysR family transcriptional regulator for bpeEF and oprC
MRRENDKFHLMNVFYEVTINGSFTKAAQSLGMTTSSVSKAVTQLEDSLHVKLLNRTTRNQSLTDNGRVYVSYAKQMLGQFKELEQRIKNQHIEPSGLFRVTMPTALGQFFIGPRIHEFLLRYPKIELDLVLSDSLVDITEQGFDLAIRSVNVPPKSSLYSVVLGQHTQKLVASPEYLKKHHLLNSPQDLTSVNLLTYHGAGIGTTWSFTSEENSIDIQPAPSYTSNSYFALLMAAKNSMGVANLYQYMVDEEIKAGNLVQLLPQWKQQAKKRYAVYQQRRDSSPKLDLFIAFVTTLFK